jgi:hypothetical protein
VTPAATFLKPRSEVCHVLKGRDSETDYIKFTFANDGN